MPAKKKKSKSEVNSGELREFGDKDVKYSKKKQGTEDQKLRDQVPGLNITMQPLQ